MQASCNALQHGPLCKPSSADRTQGWRAALTWLSRSTCSLAACTSSLASSHSLLPLLLQLIHRTALLFGEGLIALCGIAAPIPVLQEQVLRLLSEPLGLRGG